MHTSTDLVASTHCPVRTSYIRVHDRALTVLYEVDLLLEHISLAIVGKILDWHIDCLIALTNVVHLCWKHYQVLTDDISLLHGSGSQTSERFQGKSKVARGTFCRCPRGDPRPQQIAVESKTERFQRGGHSDATDSSRSRGGRGHRTVLTGY